ncbi:hypothetical protein BS78_10G192300 [Paspalum vaginatum]|nr:hypothetical protein BS78_10G192300 [Paspalum vaginatum]
MGSLKCKRVEAPRIATLEDVHPHTWTMCLRLYHKFHSEMFAPGRKRLYMILLDEGCKKMGAVIYDDEVDRLGPLLVEGRAYYVWRMSARPIYRNQEYLLAEDRDIVCHFTSETIVSEMKQVKEKCIALFPSFMPFERFWNIAFDDYKRVDIIGMVLYVSDTGFQDSHYNRRIPVKNIVLMDGRRDFKINDICHGITNRRRPTKLKFSHMIMFALNKMNLLLNTLHHNH